MVTPENLTQRVVDSATDLKIAQTIITSSPQSDIGEADVDIAIRRVKNIVPGADPIDVELVGYADDGSAVYRVRYEFDASDDGPVPRIINNLGDE